MWRRTGSLIFGVSVDTTGLAVVVGSQPTDQRIPQDPRGRRLSRHGGRADSSPSRESMGSDLHRFYQGALQSSARRTSSTKRAQALVRIDVFFCTTALPLKTISGAACATSSKTPQRNRQASVQSAWRRRPKCQRWTLRLHRLLPGDSQNDSGGCSQSAVRPSTNSCAIFLFSHIHVDAHANAPWRSSDQMCSRWSHAS